MKSCQIFYLPLKLGIIEGELRWQINSENRVALKADDLNIAFEECATNNFYEKNKAENFRLDKDNFRSLLLKRNKLALTALPRGAENAQVAFDYFVPDLLEFEAEKAKDLLLSNYPQNVTILCEINERLFMIH